MPLSDRQWRPCSTANPNMSTDCNRCRRKRFLHRQKALSPEKRKAAPFGTAFPLSAGSGRMSGENLRGGCAHQNGRERHVTMRHQTTSFQLLKH